MEKIKFSHKYRKFEIMEDKDFELLQILKVNYKDLTREFIDYDTFWCEGTEYGFYELPKTDLLILFFKEPLTYRLFTTIRRWTPEKEKYYKSKIGKSFKIEFTEENATK